jgi:hypothetical protein
VRLTIDRRYLKTAELATAPTPCSARTLTEVPGLEFFGDRHDCEEIWRAEGLLGLCEAWAGVGGAVFVACAESSSGAGCLHSCTARAGDLGGCVVTRCECRTAAVWCT